VRLGTAYASHQWRIGHHVQLFRHGSGSVVGVHLVVALALEGVVAFDLATPIEVLGRVRTVDGGPGYKVVVAGPRRTVSAGPIALDVPEPLDRLLDADTVIVPGRSDPTAQLDPVVAETLRRAAGNGTRIASICVGALDLAAAGLLNGLRATTHWQAVELLRRRHPTIDVDPSALLVDNGQILCSAGASAGIDLCLHLVARDYGGLVAADAARTAVMPLTREAGQAQFIRNDELGATGLAVVLAWIDAHAHEPVSVADIARVAAVSARTLNRRFAHELGTTPSAWLTRARVRRAQRLLETTRWSVDRIARETGLGTPTNLRARFADVVGTTPVRYRTALTQSLVTSHERESTMSLPTGPARSA
jgi:transcriptional regulator GlxA family with amidase domain